MKQVKPKELNCICFFVNFFLTETIRKESLLLQFYKVLLKFFSERKYFLGAKQVEAASTSNTFPKQLSIYWEISP